MAAAQTASAWHRTYNAGSIWPLYGAPLPQSGPSITMCLQYALKIDKEKVDKSRGKSVLQQELQVMAGRHSFCKHNQLGGAAST